MGNDLCNAQLDQEQMYRNTTNSSYGSHYTQVRGYSVSNRGSSILSQKPTGLENLTNTCYISAILQNLFLILPESMNKGKGKTTQLFFKLKASKDTRDYKMFKSQVEKFIQIVQGFQQQDAQEFLIYFLELLNNQNTQLNKKSAVNLNYNQRTDVQQNYKFFVSQMKKIQSSIISNLFSGELLRKFTCQKNHTKSKFQRYQCLSLSFPTPQNGTSFLYSSSSSEITLRQLILKQLQGQPIQGLLCQQCKRNTNFTKTTFLYTLPSYLILHLARFKKGYYNNEKINTIVEFDEQITFEQVRDKSSAKYKLVGTVNHFGNLNRGHYFAEIRHTNGLWYEINDEDVRSSSLDPTRNKSKYVYILFYQRIK